MKKHLILMVCLICLVAPVGAARAQEWTNPAQQDYKAFLMEIGVGVLATVDAGQPRTRYMQYLWNEGDKVFLGTRAHKPVYAQMLADSRVSYCVADLEQGVVLNIDGRVHFVDDPVQKQRVLDEYPDLADIYKTADNPEFILFYIQPDSIQTFDFINDVQPVNME